MTSSIAVNEQSTHNPDSLWLKGTLLVTSTLTVMAGATISPALPSITEAFADVPNSAFLVRLVLTLPALFIALGAPVAGYIVDHAGRKQLLISAAILYGIAGASGFFAGNLWILLGGRALLGIAVAGIMTTVTTLIADYYSGQARSSFLGIQAAFSGMGGVVFLTLGGMLADIGWRTPFLIYLFSFVILPFAIMFLYEPEIASKDTAQSEVKSQSLPVGLLVFGYITMAVAQVVFYAIPVQLPFYLADLVDATAAQSGLAIAALSLFFSLASASFGWFDKQFDNLPTMLLGFAITGTGFILLTLASGWLLLAIGLAAGGFGLGLVVPNIITWVASGVPEALRGRAMGGITTSLFIGQFISPFIVAPLTAQVGEGGVYAALGVFVLSAVVLGLLLREQINQLTHTSSEEK